MSDDLFWQNRIIESGYDSPENLAKGFNSLNWRGHPEAQREALEEALDSIGFLQRVLYNKTTGRVIDGHLRIELAVLKGQPLIPVDYVELTEDEEALALATLDAITEQAEPIADKLAALMERTRAMTANKPALSGMLDKLRERVGVVNGGNGGSGDGLPIPIDRAEELQKVWQVKPGDVWALGEKHRLICGDCREPETWARLLEGRKVNGIFTSPPYAEQRKQQYGGVPVAEYVGWWEAVEGVTKNILADDGSFFVNIKPHCEDYQRSLYVFDLVLTMARKWGWLYIDELCWRNTKNGVPGTWPNRLKNAFEPVYHFSKSKNIKFRPEQVGHKSVGVFDYHPLNADSRTGTPFTGSYKHLGYKEGMALPSNVIEIPAEGAGIHSAPFPVELPAFFIRAFSDGGDIWADIFCGSGTTIIACELENRVGLGCEVDPKSCSVTLERYRQVFGMTPVLC